MLRRKLVLVSVLLIVMTLTLVACDLGKPTAEDGTKSVKIVIGTNEISYATNAEYLHEMLVEMRDKSMIDYEYSEGVYGATINKINNLITDIDWDPFISIYHSIDDVTLRADFGEYAMEKYDYNGTKYYPSSVGVDSLPVKNGSVYLFVETSLN